MREILFRGKQKHSGKWVEGFYYYHRAGYSENAIIYESAMITTGINVSSGAYGERTEAIEYEVIPETVGQYTGLTDKNGKKIFEGDIIRVDDTETAVVEYDETSAFYMVVFDRAECDFGSLIEQYPNVESIGNIHDNPELLKGE